MYFYIEEVDRNHNWPATGREQKLQSKGPMCFLSIKINEGSDLITPDERISPSEKCQRKQDYSACDT